MIREYDDNSVVEEAFVAQQTDNLPNIRSAVSNPCK